jgi:hypothetical protein
VKDHDRALDLPRLPTGSGRRIAAARRQPAFTFAVVRSGCRQPWGPRGCTIAPAIAGGDADHGVRAREADDERHAVRASCVHRRRRGRIGRTRRSLASPLACEGPAVLTLMPDLPAGVVGVEAHGEVTSDDYERVLVPAVEAARAESRDGKVRLLYVLGPQFPDYTAGAAWEDTKLGLGHLRSWERIALVGDADWLRRAVRGLGWLMPGEIKVFETKELDGAREWVTSLRPEPEPFY